MVYIAADKHGYNAIKIVEGYLTEKNLPYLNLGVKGEEEDMKLEDMIPTVVAEVLKDEKNRGILSCGTGIGIDIGANRFQGIRACLATTPKIAEWSVVYDKCNVLCLAGWDSEKSNIYAILDAWFKSEYDGSQERLEMFKVFDAWH